MKNPHPVLVYCPHAHEQQAYLDAFRREAATFDFVSQAELADSGVDADRIHHIICWGAPPEFFRPFRQLRAVFALGAGIDRLIGRTDLPESVAIYRLLDAGMAEQMLEYVLYGVLGYQRGFDHYWTAQQQNQWRPLRPRAASEVQVTVLGGGIIGGHVAQGLHGRGYPVTLWSRSGHAPPGIASASGSEALPALLAQTDVLVSLLPSTAATRGLLNGERLQLLRRDALLINAGRGDVLDESALLAALASGQLRGALLDVFASEPLPPSHPFWRHPGITLTPHIAAQTLLPEAVRQIADNLRALEYGQSPTGRVDRSRGY